jgi:hypothetical protein
MSGDFRLLTVANDYTQFIAWPEMTRAVMMATATHNIDGGKFTHFSSYSHIDRRDGAGIINANQSTILGLPNQWTPPFSAPWSRGRFAQTLNFSTDFATNGESNSVWKLRSVMNGRIRVVITWDSSTTGCDTGNCSGDTLDADLDLFITRPNNGEQRSQCAVKEA